MVFPTAVKGKHQHTFQRERTAPREEGNKASSGGQPGSISEAGRENHPALSQASPAEILSGLFVRESHFYYHLGGRVSKKREKNRTLRILLIVSPWGQVNSEFCL